jgi:hypothetical protein
MRLRVESRTARPVFAGVARTADVERYLAGASHTEVTDIDTDPFEAELPDARGRRHPPPATQDIWVASTEGPARARSTGSPRRPLVGRRDERGRLARRRRRRQRRRESVLGARLGLLGAARAARRRGVGTPGAAR